MTSPNLSNWAETLQACIHELRNAETIETLSGEVAEDERRFRREAKDKRAHVIRRLEAMLRQLRSAA